MVICDQRHSPRHTYFESFWRWAQQRARAGRLYLCALAAAGQAGVERALSNLQSEIERGMKLMGISSLNQLSPDMVRRRQV